MYQTKFMQIYFNILTPFPNTSSYWNTENDSGTLSPNKTPYISSYYYYGNGTKY